MDSIHEPEQLELPIFPKHAVNRHLNREFPYFDEREDAILIEDPRTGQPVWSPKNLWIFNNGNSRLSESEESKETPPKSETLLRAWIVDKTKAWSFNITEDEHKALKSGELQLYWNSGWKNPKLKDQKYSVNRRFSDQWLIELDKLKNIVAQYLDYQQRLGIDLLLCSKCLKRINRAVLAFLHAEQQKYNAWAKKEKQRLLKEYKRRKFRGWCLVTSSQRELLSEGVNYNDHHELLLKEGSDVWNDWSRIRWLMEEPWRQYKEIKRVPVIKRSKADGT